MDIMNLDFKIVKHVFIIVKHVILWKEIVYHVIWQEISEKIMHLNVVAKDKEQVISVILLYV